jgi:hypothetical protein
MKFYLFALGDSDESTMRGEVLLLRNLRYAEHIAHAVPGLVATKVKSKHYKVYNLQLIFLM